MFCVNDRVWFRVARFHHDLLLAAGAVGTVEKRGLFFHGFPSPDPYLAVSFPQSCGLFSRQAVFVDDSETVERGFPVVH